MIPAWLGLAWLGLAYPSRRTKHLRFKAGVISICCSIDGKKRS
jgi:hypothetical protein